MSIENPSDDHAAEVGAILSEINAQQVQCTTGLSLSLPPFVPVVAAVALRNLGSFFPKAGESFAGGILSFANEDPPFRDAVTSVETKQAGGDAPDVGEPEDFRAVETEVLMPAILQRMKETDDSARWEDGGDIAALGEMARETGKREVCG